MSALAQPRLTPVPCGPGEEPIYRLPIDAVFLRLGTSRRGLSSAEAARRLDQFGLNHIVQVAGVPLWQRFLRNFVQIFALLLWLSAALSFLSGSPTLGWAIILVIVVNAAFSFAQEFQAERAVEALRDLLPARASVVRDGERTVVLAEALVPGDLVVLEEGDHLSADSRLVAGFEVRVVTAAVTGESEPVVRTPDPVLDENVLTIQASNLVLAGSTIASGTGLAAVYATGMNTEFGKIARLTGGVQEKLSPLQVQIQRIARIIAGLAVVSGLLIFAAGTLLAALPIRSSLVFAIGIITANVPEGLLPTLTLALAASIRRLAARHALVKRLSAVETLGATTVICTDKTGTLTQNEMTVREVWLDQRSIGVTGVGYDPEGRFTADARQLDRAEVGQLGPLLEAATLCNNARLLPPGADRPRWSILGDPTEGALLVAARKAGVDDRQVRAAYPRVYEIPFESRRKRMAVVCRVADEYVAFVKGAPKETIERCTQLHRTTGALPLDEASRSAIMDANDRLARSGLRVLAVARRTVPLQKHYSAEDTEQELTFLGLLAMLDPPRPEVAAAIGISRHAGIRTMMITGDYGLTAKAIAVRIGMVTPDEAFIITGSDVAETSDLQLRQELSRPGVIFARVAPEHKMRIARILRDSGQVVAMTGDGVNDAPALREADIGIAMGVVGTDVAREAAEMILTDDNFATIVGAVEEGRVVFDNIRRFCVYIFTHLGPEAIPFIAFALFRLPLAITPIQILAIDLGTDTLPALALGLEKAEPGIMDRPPRRPNEPLLTTGLLLRSYLFFGVIETVFVMAGFFWVLTQGGWHLGAPLAASSLLYRQATTMGFLGIVGTQLGTLSASRTNLASLFAVGLLSNRWIVVGAVFSIALTAALIYVPFARNIFGMTPLTPLHYLIALLYGVVLVLADEVRKLIVRQRLHRPPAERGPG
ncbi:MAG TPA: cation-transporting P-type ATPase [Chloroflexota bacterium]|nr:cation-transporting P-type ATPase [Chloroflexota bacterium]